VQYYWFNLTAQLKSPGKAKDYLAMVDISVVNGDILKRGCDLLILKHADGFYGVDAIAADRLGFSQALPANRFAIVPGTKVKATQVLFMGVGQLGDFRYSQIRKFGARSLELANQKAPHAQKICMPIHGPGYGLDENEAFLSLVAGLTDSIDAGKCSPKLEKVEIVENYDIRAKRLHHLLDELFRPTASIISSRQSVTVEMPSRKSVRGRQSKSIRDELAQYGAPSEKKVRMFVAMPFKDDYTDEYDIAITEATQYANIVCERLDKQAYVGDIVEQIRKQIEASNGLLALLNDANPNVYLEVGYAWARKKPLVLIVRKDQQLPFDLRGQKYIIYSNISDLRTKLKAELKSLNDNGVLSGKK
jgi:hypothetical protein